MVDRPRLGRPPRLNGAQTAELDRLVEARPDVAMHGVARWRCVDLQAEIKARFALELSERQVGRLLKARAARYLPIEMPRPL